MKMNQSQFEKLTTLALAKHYQTRGIVKLSLYLTLFHLEKNVHGPIIKLRL